MALKQRLQALPGIQAVGLTNTAPFMLGMGIVMKIRRPGMTAQ